MALRSLPLLDLLLPSACAACHLPGPALCARCRSRIVPLEGPHCRGCGGPVGVATTRCGECLGPLRSARQAAVYEGVAAALVGALKDARRRDVAPELAALVVERLPPPPPASVLVPVPGRPAGVRERGFDHAERIAADLARRWRLASVRALARRRDAPAQRGSVRSKRVVQAAGRFGLRTTELPSRIVLVDDVRTTGATLAECARVLLEAGAQTVDAVCVARAVRGGPVQPDPANER